MRGYLGRSRRYGNSFFMTGRTNRKAQKRAKTSKKQYFFALKTVFLGPKTHL